MREQSAETTKTNAIQINHKDTENTKKRRKINIILAQMVYIQKPPKMGVN
jgi:hypothetical protein